jgi:serine/threonine protein kinase
VRGSLPFYSEEKELTFKYTILGDFIMEGDTIFDNLSMELKDLIRGLLEVDAEARLTVQQALDHPWFTSKPVQKKMVKTGGFDFTNFV